MSLVAIAGCVGAASVCNKHKVILNKVYGLLLAILNINYLLCDFLVADGFDYYILTSIPYSILTLCASRYFTSGKIILSY